MSSELETYKPILERIRWDQNGLVPVIAQDAVSGTVLMFAWMNHEALAKTIELKRAVYFSRSRKKLWFKGEESGHVQHVKSLRMDCDQDVLLLQVEQVGGIACHTGRNSCFFEAYDWQAHTWFVDAPVLKNPDDIYDTK
ncbi:phosphoribosyl-AMP cyclohydrolase [Hydromonas duriensis]|uniref:Phosphoribosyl-AMP cyclohydrolase n=1 Tax=Hydromonas duriensis TaxID=1527608 RepID=A0A4R6Y7Q1_9BURK|nr:phosphoribosyl-AMP cyclohydrolase [Hydromonas duriensis]TDR31373.1 phosphoribosyl-AMP cyclohydrolase [Hydromonas duriensis]